jgi:ankyrin repeat protein
MKRISSQLPQNDDVLSKLKELFLQGSFEQVCELLTRKPQLAGIADANGDTPLHWAEAGTPIEVIRLLVKAGANVNATNALGQTPLHNAAKNGCSEMLFFLIENGANATAKDIHGFTPLFYAVLSGQDKLARALRRHGAMLSLHEAAALGLANECESLLSANPQLVNARDNNGWTPLFLARDVRIAKLLFKFGADAQISAPDGFTPLHAAVGYGVELIEELIKHGANVNATCSGNLTPLHMAAELGKIDEIKTLLSYGADLEHKTAWGATARDLAKTHGRMVAFSLLSTKGGSLKVRHKDK